MLRRKRSLLPFQDRLSCNTPLTIGCVNVTTTILRATCNIREARSPVIPTHAAAPALLPCAGAFP